MLKYAYLWARSSVVEHLPFKQGVGGSIPPGLTTTPSSSGQGHWVFIPKIEGSNPSGVTLLSVPHDPDKHGCPWEDPTAF